MQNNQKIPEGWSVKKLGEVGTFTSGMAFPEKEQGGSDGVPFFKVSDMNLPENNYFMKGANNYVTIKQIEALKYKPVQCTAIIFAKVGAAIFLERKRLAKNFLMDNNMMAFIPYDNPQYFKILFDTIHLSKYVQVGALPSYNSSDLRTIKVLLPPLAEQEKIAGILGTWDEAIEKLSDLIEQKKLLKKGLMQKLLTGKTRLPGFTQPWKEVKLGKICKLETTTSKSAFIDENGKYYIIDMGAVSTEGTLISSKRTNACEGLLKINDIVMPKDDIGGGNIIGKTAIIKQENTYVLSDHVFKLNIHDSDANFISYLINSYGYNKYMRRMSCGSAILGLSKKDVEKCLLYIPSDISEQQAIADVLSTADDEINLLNQKLEALKEQKKGLMQQLLTGQIRVKVN